MREIKFRVFVEKTQEMLTWSKLQAIKQFALDDGIKPKDVILIPVNDKTHTMQYTGLKDKNGLTEVYECDIISENGLVKGNIYETSEVDKRETDIVVPSITSKEWHSAYKKLMDRGLRHT